MSKKYSNKIGILGYGEVGKAVAKFYKNPKIKDLKRNDRLEDIEILHICIPWSDSFTGLVKKEIKKAEPKLTIIHSTVAPSTTRKIAFGLPQRLRRIVHSPVRGVHPNLYEGIKTFVKYIGADSKEAADFAGRHFKSLGIKTKIFYPSVTTEIGKLLDTTYYGLCVAWHGEMKKICSKYKIDFEKAVTDFNETYNEGYKKLNKKNVVRPVLYPPQMSGGIKGHCIVENARILQKYCQSEAFNLILAYKPQKKL